MRGAGLTAQNVSFLKEAAAGSLELSDVRAEQLAATAEVSIETVRQLFAFEPRVPDPAYFTHTFFTICCSVWMDLCQRRQLA